MTTDNKKDRSLIQYNHLNLPTSVTFADDRSIRYTYDATGVKLKKEIFLSLPDLFNPFANTTTYYAGNYIYEKDGSGESLKFFSHPEGYIEKNGSNYDYVYQYKDHSCLRRVPQSAARGRHIRLSYQDMNNDGSVNSSEIKEENNYYPFGLEHKGYGTDRTSNHPYKFGGKEFNEELGLDWYDVSARNYDPALGRWMNIDPLAEKYYAYSSYAYVMNNPLIYTDPTGMSAESVQDDYGMKDGKIFFVNETDDNFDRIVKTNRKGEAKTNRKGAKVKIDNVAKGILKDGQNFETGDTMIELGGEHNLTADGIDDFAFKLSEHVNKEIGGTYYAYNGSETDTHVIIGKYDTNTMYTTKNKGMNPKKFVNSAEEYLKYIKTKSFHTHPTVFGNIHGEGATKPYESSPDDNTNKSDILKTTPNLKFYIIARARKAGSSFERIKY